MKALPSVFILLFAAMVLTGCGHKITEQLYGKEVNIIDIAGACWHFVEQSADQLWLDHSLLCFEVVADPKASIYFYKKPL